MSAVPIAPAGAPYILKTSASVPVSSAGATGLLQSLETLNNFIDFNVGNVIEWITTTQVDSTDMSVQMLVDGTVRREWPYDAIYRTRQAPFPGFPVAIPASRRQFRWLAEGDIGTAGTVNVNFYLRAPPAGAG